MSDTFNEALKELCSFVELIVVAGQGVFWSFSSTLKYRFLIKLGFHSMNTKNNAQNCPISYFDRETLLLISLFNFLGWHKFLLFFVKFSFRQAEAQSETRLKVESVVLEYDC